MKVSIFGIYLTLWAVGELGTLGGLLSGHLGIFAVCAVLWVSSIAIASKYAK